MSLVQGNTDTVAGTIVDADGNVVGKPTVILSQQEADLLRQYKKFLQKRGIRDASFCNTCWSGDLNDGMRVFVRDDKILFECRHRMLYFEGQSF